MFVFCNYRKGLEILNLLKKIYKFVPQTQSPNFPPASPQLLKQQTLSNSS